MISLTLSLPLKLYLNSWVYYHLWVFLESLGQCSESFREIHNVRVTFGQPLENHRKSSESDLKYSKNRQKRRQQYVDKIKRTHATSKIWIFCFPLARTLRYSCHSNINILSPPCNILHV